MRKVATPTQKTCEAVAELLGLPLTRTVKSVAVVGDAKVLGGTGFVLALVRGDHVVNEIKLSKIAGLAEHRMDLAGRDRERHPVVGKNRRVALGDLAKLEAGGSHGWGTGGVGSAQAGRDTPDLLAQPAAGGRTLGAIVPQLVVP